MICLRKKMNRFFRKSKSPSPSISEKSKVKSASETPQSSVEHDSLGSKGVVVDDSSLSEHSHISSCTASDDSKDFPSVVTLEVPVTKNRSLSFDGMIRTLNQLGSKDSFLKVPANDRSWADCGKGSLSSQTNSTSQSTSNLTLMSTPGQSSSPKGSESQFKCIHCMYLNSLAEADNFVVVGDLCGQARVTSAPPRARQRASISSNSSCSALTGSDLSDYSENESSDRSSTNSNFQRGGDSYGSRNPHGMERLSPPIFVSAADPVPLAPTIANEGISRHDSGPCFDVNSYSIEAKEEIGNEPNSCADSEKASTCSNFSLNSSCDPLEARISDWKEAVTLQVPLFKPRSSSLDVQYNIELHAGNGGSSDDRRSSCEQLLSVEGDPYKQHRSTSVDVNLPTEGSTDYKAILVHRESNKKAIASQHNSNFLHPRHAEFGFKKREPRSTVDWSESANNGEHIWVDTNASGDSCYLGESECVRSGIRKKCVSCKIVAHTLCISRLEQMLLRCKPTFCEGSHRNYRENTVTRHHWVHRRRQDGKCSKCGKSFQQRFSFQSKEIIAIGCSWCKLAYHNKAACFPMSSLEEKCTLGEHSKVIIPPSWIIKLPRKGYFKSSVCRKKKLPLKKRDSKEDQFKSFIVKPIPSPALKPLLVFINPRSGGNQGTKIMQKFFWYLNPRQVFDLTQTKPQVALELYHKVMNLRILACGGDGTVGWILSVIDHLAMNPAPPVAILPLGTGNDMARTLNWGGGYTDEPVGKILNSTEESVVVQVDRWNLNVESLPSYEEATTSGSGLGGDEVGVTNLPINVMNNYFSIGADANVTLEFHESREAKPEKFNSRFRNKMFYAGVGGIDILKRSWKDLTEYISVECDGQNFDSVVRQSKFHCLLFLNIPKYAAGTNPWGNSSSGNFRPQRPDDGFLEVVGFTAASLASLQMGAHSGVRVTQCRHARLTTYKPMPVQVDGEPCRLVPSIIDIARRNQANMLQKPKLRGSALLLNLNQPSDQGPPRILVRLVAMGDYESLNHDKEKLNKASICMTTIEADSNCDLSVVRKLIRAGMSRTNPDGISRIPGLSSQWSFIDTLTADQCFRIPRSKEHQHYISDVTSNDIFVLDPRNPLVCYADRDVSTFVEELHVSVPVVNSSSNLSSDEQKSSQSSDTEEMRIQSEKDYAGSVFLLACKSGDLNTIANLKNLTDFSVLDSITGMTGLHYSAMHGHTPVVEYLVHEVSPTILDSMELGKSQTALHKAASIVDRKVCIRLVIAGCKSTLRDNEGFLPSMLALQSNDVELSKFLKRVEKAEFRDLGMSESLSPDSCSEPEIDQETEADL